MATGKSGSFVITPTSNNGLSIGSFRMSWSETYDIATNTSSVSITKLELLCGGDGYGGQNYGLGNLWFNGSVSINGTVVATITRGSHFLCVPDYGKYKELSISSPALPWSTDVIHNDDGSKSITISASIHGQTQNLNPKTNTNINGSTVVQLTNIPRASSISVSDGTLGVAQTIKVKRQSALYAHSIFWQCGGASGWVSSWTQAESIQFTPDISLASQNTSGTSVPVTFTLQTYNGSTAIGSAVTKTVTMAIPTSVKPSCTLTISDPTGYRDIFGGYVQSKSKFKIKVNPNLAYGSPIASYSITADGNKYVNQESTTPEIKSSGSVAISATVTDSRGRSGSVSKSENVLAYANPKITMLSVHRCNSDGTENPNGSFAVASYSFGITSLSNKNTKEIKLLYKKSTETTWTEIVLPSVYSATNANAVFPADDGSTYDVKLSVKDYWTTVTQKTSVSTASVTFHVHPSGKGFAFGKISEEENCLDIGWGKLKVGGYIVHNGFVSNPNLLDNWYFGNPVNQRGLKTYSPSSNTIDRWKTTGGCSALKILNGCVSAEFSTSGGAVDQFLDIPFENGDVVTLSALIRATAVKCGIQGHTGSSWTSTKYTSAVGEWQLVTLTYTMETIENGVTRSVRFRSGAVGSKLEIKAIKLELGSQQTLAHKENDVWVLNEIPDFGEQLRKCQRYFQVCNIPFVPSVFAGERKGTILFQTVMRTTPSVEFIVGNAQYGNISVNAVDATAVHYVVSNATYPDVVYVAGYRATADL